MNQTMQQKSDNKSGNSPEINHKSIKSPSPEEANSKEPARQDYISHLFSYTSAVGGAETTSERFSSILTGPGFSHSANSTPRNQTFIQMQQTFGNHYVQRMVEKSRNSSREPGTRIQAKLKIGQTNDIYEQEADRIADQVMQMPKPGCPECKENEEEQILQTKRAHNETSVVSVNIKPGIHALKGKGQPHHFRYFGKSRTIRLKGHTDPYFDGGSFKTVNIKEKRGVGCKGCSESQCVHVTGNLVATYSVTTTVTLPKVSDYKGLRPCQKRRVKDAIDNILAPHEQKHVDAFNTYNGTTRRSFDMTICRSEFNGIIKSMFK